MTTQAVQDYHTDERLRLWALQAMYDKDLDAYAARRSGETAVVILSPRSG